MPRNAQERATEQPAEETSEEAKQAENKPQVRYVGPKATIRQVTKEEWARAGLSDQDTVMWTRQNEYSVDKERLSAAALDLLAATGGFEIDN